jgi:putative effector of murein hydrolase LrgA (UPF0299 family)
VIASESKLPKLFLPPGSGILGYTALTSFGHIGTARLMIVDVVLVVGVIGWVLMAWWPRFSHHVPGDR